MHLLLILFLVSIACSAPSVTYLSPDFQEGLPFSLVKLVPYKSYSRKNIGYLFAIQVRTCLDVFDFQMTSRDFSKLDVI